MITTTLLAILLNTNIPIDTEIIQPRTIDVKVELAREISPKNRRMLRKINKGNRKHWRRMMKGKGVSSLKIEEVNHV